MYRGLQSPLSKVALHTSHRLILGLALVTLLFVPIQEVSA